MIISVEQHLESMGIQVKAMDDYIQHYGTPRRSGRYPWGSGKEGLQSSRDFLSSVAELKKQGLSDTEIAKGLGMNTSELRNYKAIAKNAIKQDQYYKALALKEKSYSNVAISKELGIPEPSVRALLSENTKDKLQILDSTADVLREKVDNGAYLDIGTGVELHMGITRTKLDQAIAKLKDEGYEVHNVQVDQLGTNNKTTIKVLTPPKTEYKDVAANISKIDQIKAFSEDGGRSYLGLLPPLNIDSKRIAVNYDEDGGSDADGVIYVRPGVKDISIGANRYAQVRIAVDGTHYLKGMAVYKEGMPEGVDLIFNTNKSRSEGKLGVMKAMKDDPDNPFGSVVHQLIDPKTGKVTSAMNIVGGKEGAGEEGSWGNWSRNLAPQFLSKQSLKLAKDQLDITFGRKKEEFDEIMALTNPAVKKKLLESFADGADSSSVHMKAAALPRQATHVILPVKSLKETEVYAPNYDNGERVALVRFPHGGRFEIPEVTVNNRNPEARKLLGTNAKDAIGIHPKVAERLSGADFDGDAVLVIPNNSGKVKSAPALQGLRDFDPRRSYPGYEGMKKMTAQQKAQEMGSVSNLITDMTIMGATNSELARAVRHSMVVIDAEKHGLNWKESARQNNIDQLQVKYQGKKGGGASTLISRAGGRKDVPARKPRPASLGGPIDKKTGKKVYVDASEPWVDSKGRTRFKTQRSTKLAETDDARTLVSKDGGTKIESVYADHSNRLKALANQARLESTKVKPTPYSPSARKVYETEVKSLDAKLKTAVSNRPLERQAQVIANSVVRSKRDANPDMSSDDLKKIKFQALDAARLRTGAGKQRIEITDREWEAIQAGAIRNARLSDILAHTDVSRVKELATPRQKVLMSPSKINRARQLEARGYTQAEIAEAIGVSLSTLKRGIE